MNADNTSTAEENESQVSALLHEHGQLVALFIHEDSMAWQLLLAIAAADAAIATAAYNLHPGIFDTSGKPQLVLWFVLGLGVFINLNGFFIMQRSNVHHLSRIFRGKAVEAQLKDLERPVLVFSSAEVAIHKGKMLTPDGQTYRELRWYERVKSLMTGRFLLLFLAMLFLVALIWLWFCSPCS